MKTIFYVPPEERVEDYEGEAILFGTPIVHGMPAGILRDHPGITPPVAGIVKVPETHTVQLEWEEISVGTHQLITFIDEYNDLRGKVSLSLYEERSKTLIYEDLDPQFTEMHRARWVCYITKIGKYVPTIYRDGEKVDHHVITFYAFKKLKK